MIKKNKERSCIILIKRRDFFLTTHIYINGKLIFLTNYEQEKSKIKFFKYLKKYILSVVKKLLYYKFEFEKISFIFQFKKKRRKIKRKFNAFLFKNLDKKKEKKKKKKRKNTKTHLSISIITKLVFYMILLKKKINIKYLYNTSHSFANEKVKKKRRK